MSTSRSFKIEDFKVIPEGIEIEVHDTGSDLAIPFEISGRSFRNFLLVNDLLNWEMNMSDYTGEHVQTSGQMTFLEYLAMPNEIIIKDIYDYIKEHPIIYRKDVYANAEECIVQAFETRRLQRIINPEY